MSFAHLATQVGQLQWVDTGAQAWVTDYPMGSETFGQLLRRLREDAGYSQEGLAAEVGLSRKTIQTIENTRSRPRIKNEVAVITRIAAKVGVRVSELSTMLGWVPIEEAKPTAWERGLSSEQKQAVTHMAELLRAKAEDPPESTAVPQRRARS